MKHWNVSRWLCLGVVFACFAVQSTVFAAYDFVQNGDFRQGLAHWTVSQAGKDATLSVQDGEVEFRGTLGSVQHGIQQSLEFDAGSYSSLILSATLRVDEAKLSGTGLDGLEAPIGLYVSYTDIAGIEHRQAISGPGGRFWRGFYYETPTPPAVSTNGVKVERGIWQEFQFDLMTLEPRPKWIHAIGAEGAGWARRAAALKRLSLIAPEEGRELVANFSFTRLAAGWLPCVDFIPTDYQAGLVSLPQGMQIQSTIGDRRIGLLQKIETDVSGFQSLRVSAEVKVDKQRMSGTGYDGREAPLALFVTYTDVKGVKHDQLPLNTSDTEKRLFWRGLYILKPQPPASEANGIFLETGVWSTISFELMELEPKPKVIHSVGIEGSGRSPRDASVRWFSVKGR